MNKQVHVSITSSQYGEIKKLVKSGKYKSICDFGREAVRSMLLEELWNRGPDKPLSERAYEIICSSTHPTCRNSRVERRRIPYTF